MDGQQVLPAALRFADLAMAQWLLDEAGCSLPKAHAGVSVWVPLMEAAARSADGVAKLQWLQGMGAPPLRAIGGDLAGRVVCAAAERGQVEVVRHLLHAL